MSVYFANILNKISNIYIIIKIKVKMLAVFKNPELDERFF